MKFAINKTKEGLGQIQTTLHWGLRIINPASAVGDFPENLEIRVTSSGIPIAEENEIPVELQGHTINFAGKVKKAGEIALTFVEGIDAGVTSYFTTWRTAKWSSDGTDTQGKQALTNALKADLELTLYSPDDTPTQIYKMIGAMPKITAIGDLGQTSDPLSPQITFVYDDFHFSKG